jgi:hypothetical protein
LGAAVGLGALALLRHARPAHGPPVPHNPDAAPIVSVRSLRRIGLVLGASAGLVLSDAVTAIATDIVVAGRAIDGPMPMWADWIAEHWRELLGGILPFLIVFGARRSNGVLSRKSGDTHRLNRSNWIERAALETEAGFEATMSQIGPMGPRTRRIVREVAGQLQGRTYLVDTPTQSDWAGRFISRRGKAGPLAIAINKAAVADLRLRIGLALDRARIPVAEDDLTVLAYRYVTGHELGRAFQYAVRVAEPGSRGPICGGRPRGWRRHRPPGGTPSRPCHNVSCRWRRRAGRNRAWSS